MQTSKEHSDSGTINQLNSFLRGELSAVETYRQALDKLERFPQRATLEQCARSHEERARILADEVRRRGGDPSDGSGAWGTFAKLVEGGAAVFGEKAAIAALEEGEDHGRDDYKRDIKDLDAAALEVIQNQVIPEQNRTHQAMSALKRTLS
jgi:demethoxyubiquinone hydroxylase (CLK1/Coq7/Cat5 family)